MLATKRMLLATVILGAVCLVPKGATAQEAKGGVECSWTCHCARQLRDCDRKESRWDICLDTARTTHPDKVESCDRCKQVAEGECRKRVCPPDPDKGPKFLFQYFCDGRPQELSAVPPRIGGGMVASPSVGRMPARSAKQQRGETASEVGAREVKCTFHCACTVETGMCDDHEKRLQLCVDKADSSITGPNCLMCEVRARIACGARKCPLARRATKVMTSFQCPAP